MNRFIMTSFILGGLATPLQVQALRTLVFKDQARQEATISSKAFNRIMIAQDRIRQIMAHGSFDIETDEASGQAFLHPQPAKEPLYVTLISEKARTYELKLIVKNTEPTTLLIEDESFAKTKAEEKILEADNAKARPPELKGTSLRALPADTSGVALPWQDYETKAYSFMPRDYYRQYPGYEVHALGLNATSPQKVGLFYGLTYRGDIPKILSAEEFLKPGDRAASISLKQARPGQPFYLYIERARP